MARTSRAAWLIEQRVITLYHLSNFFYEVYDDGRGKTVVGTRACATTRGLGVYGHYVRLDDTAGLYP